MFKRLKLLQTVCDIRSKLVYELETVDKFLLLEQIWLGCFLNKLLQGWIDNKQCVLRQGLKIFLQCVHAHKTDFAKGVFLVLSMTFLVKCEALWTPSFFILTCSLEKSPTKTSRENNCAAFLLKKRENGYHFRCVNHITDFARVRVKKSQSGQPPSHDS